MRKRLSKFPLNKPFEELSRNHEFSEVVLRLIARFESEDAYVVGTAVFLCGNMLLTARHVVEEILRTEKLRLDIDVTVPGNLIALQVVRGPEYQFWNVMKIYICPNTDLAFLHLASEPWYTGEKPLAQEGYPVFSAFPPSIGETVAAIGYRDSKIRISRNVNGGFHHDWSDKTMMSVGKVREIFPVGRDRFFLPFPCYQVSARFDAGMSGGPVYDETGAICGIVCTNLEGAHETGEPVSYVCTLWPMFGVNITADRGDNYQRGIKYPAYELARDKQIHVTDLEKLLAMYPNQP
jgi:hypothetical protein